MQEAINSSEEEGILNEAEGDMLQSIFEFGDTIVREVMVPRTDMVCCSADVSCTLAVSDISALSQMMRRQIWNKEKIHYKDSEIKI